MVFTTNTIGYCFEFIRNGKSIKQSGSEGLPITRIETIASGVVNLNKVGYANIQTLNGLEDYQLKPGDILMSHINSEKHLGKVALFQEKKTVIHGMNLLCLRPKDYLDCKFATLFFKSHLFKNQISKITKKSVNQASFTVTALRKLKIPLPPLETQKRIVDILDKAQELIDKRKEQIALMDELVQSIFYDMFGDTYRNLKNFDEVTLSKLIDSKRGISYGVVQRGDHVENGVPLIRIRDLIHGSFNENEVVKTTKENSDKYKRTILKGGEFLISIRGTVGKFAIAPIHTKGWNITREVAIIPVVGIINHTYLFHYLKSNGIQRKILGDVKGVAQSGINLKDLRELIVYKPPINLQNQFAERVQRIKDQKKKMETSLSEMEDNFNSLMQRAFKGEI